MIICYAVAIVLILGYGVLCARDNRARATSIESSMAAERDWMDLTDKENEAFKYTT